MERARTKADLPAEIDRRADDRAATDAGAVTAQTTSAPYQELLVSWCTTTALAWGAPVRMWSEIVAAAWRPFLPPTALTADARSDDSLPAEPTGRADAPVPARPAPQAAKRTPRVDAPVRPAPGKRPRR